MFTNQSTKKRLVAFLAASALVSSQALAATQVVTANIAFDTALSITKNADIQFGVVKALQTGNYTISTAAVVTPAGGGVWISGTPAAGDLTIAGSTTQTINISVGSYTANNAVTPSAATCDYDGGGEGTCALNGVAAPGAGKTLLIGIKVTPDGSQAAGTSAAPTATFTVVYG